MSGNDYLKQWYRIQLILVSLLGFLVVGHDFTIRRQVAVSAMFLVVVALIALAVDLYERAPQWLVIANRWLQAILQPLMLIIAWGFVTRLLITQLHLPARGTTALMCLYYMAMFAPFAERVAKGFEFVIARIFLLTYWFMLIVPGQLIMFPAHLALSNHLEMMMQAGTFGAFAFLISVTTLMREWHLSWPGIKPARLQWWVVTILLVIMVAFLALNGGLFDGTIRHAHHLNFLYLSTAIEAAVAEETLCRFAFLGIILKAMSRFSQRVPWAVVLSAALFGLLHLTNLTEQSAGITIYQALAAFGIGLMLAVIYLYTGQLWLTMVLHFGIDITAFTSTGATTMTGHVGNNEWIGLLIFLVPFIAATAWMMFGQRRRVMDENARRLTGSDQRFGYRIDYWSSHDLY